MKRRRQASNGSLCAKRRMQREGRKEKGRKRNKQTNSPASSTLKVKWMLIENSNQSEKSEQQKKHRKGLPGGRKSLLHFMTAFKMGENSKGGVD